MSRHISNIAFTIAFIAILACAIAFFEQDADAVSATENRKLAAFPQLHDESGGVNPTLRSDVEAYLNDRIGFRAALVRGYSNIKFRILNTSPSPLVHIGMDGWYFFTSNKNLQLADGTYPLTGEMLETIAVQQQEISDHYKARGIEYFLMMTPSKATVYPEFIGGGDYSARETAIDTVAGYLEAHTDVKVINSKPLLVESKDVGQLFRKTDSHFTTLGSYQAYRSIIAVMNEAGALDAHDVPVTIFDQDYGYGEVGALMGDPQMIHKETAPGVSWEIHSAETNSGEQYEKVKQQWEQERAGRLFLRVFQAKNPAAEGGSLIVYGDSQIQAAIKIPWLMSEHFKNVTYLGIEPDFSPAIEDMVEPDVVLFTCSERLIADRLLYYKVPS